tara:strand:- start:2 stop:766 length:765 start_codon:yes stop_codon:yes gene_type:complete
MDNDNVEHKYYKPFFSLIIINIHWILHILCIIIDPEVDVNSISPNESWPITLRIFSSCPNCIDLRYQIWRLYTYSLLHKDLEHLFFNLICLFSLGSVLEIFIGHFKVSLFYFSSIILSAFSISIFSPYTVVVGVSGAVYGFLGGLTSFFFIQINESYFYIGLILIIIIISIDILLFYLQNNSNTSYNIHLFGFINSFILGFIIINPIKKLKYHKVLKFICFPILVGFYIFLIHSYIFLDYAKDSKYKNECCFLK